jgi:hypothetical protein
MRLTCARAAKAHVCALWGRVSATNVQFSAAVDSHGPLQRNLGDYRPMSPHVIAALDISNVIGLSVRGISARVIGYVNASVTTQSEPGRVAIASTRTLDPSRRIRSIATMKPPLGSLPIAMTISVWRVKSISGSGYGWCRSASRDIRGSIDSHRDCQSACVRMAAVSGRSGPST